MIQPDNQARFIIFFLLFEHLIDTSGELHHRGQQQQLQYHQYYSLKGQVQFLVRVIWAAAVFTAVASEEIIRMPLGPLLFSLGCVLFVFAK